MPRAIISRTTSASASLLATSTHRSDLTATTWPGKGPGMPRGPPERCFVTTRYCGAFSPWARANGAVPRSPTKALRSISRGHYCSDGARSRLSRVRRRPRATIARVVPWRSQMSSRHRLATALVPLAWLASVSSHAKTGAPVQADAAPSAQEIMSAFTSASTGNVADAVDEATGVRGFMARDMKPVFKAKVIGPAATVLPAPGAAHRQARLAQPPDPDPGRGAAGERDRGGPRGRPRHRGGRQPDGDHGRRCAAWPAW